MSSSSCSSASLLFIFSALLLYLIVTSSAQTTLSLSFYDKTCPNLQTIVQRAVNAAVSKEKRMGASLLRLHFHDCFVNGCDGSVLLDDTPTFKGEKTAVPNNNSARGFEVIDDIKTQVEANCKGVVSCADILTLAAKDSVVALGGQSWNVSLGRRDATTTSTTAANNGIPPPTTNLTQLIQFFSNVGLNANDMVVLAGAHTIGQARCTNFRARIYNESNINASFKAAMQQNCPLMGKDNNLSPLDVQTPAAFDSKYYLNLKANKGLLHSDQQLYFPGASTRTTVEAYLNQNKKFLGDFAKAMIKMGNIKATGKKLEVRKNCRVVNS